MLDKLYTVVNEYLVITGIADWRSGTKKVNEFIRCHATILHARNFLTTLSQTMNNMRMKLSQLTQMGLPLPFLFDDSVATMEHIATKIEEKQQD